jgi:hypothetical protein
VCGAGAIAEKARTANSLLLNLRNKRTELEQGLEACLSPVKAIQNSSGLRRLLQSAVRLLSHIYSEYKGDKRKFQDIRIADLLRLSEYKSVDKKTSMIEVIMRLAVGSSAKGEQLMQEMVAELTIPLATTKEMECLGFQQQVETTKKEVQQLSKLVQEAVERSTAAQTKFMSEAEIDYNFGLARRLAEVREHVERVEGLEQKVKEFETQWGRLRKYLANDPALCPPIEVVDQIKEVGKRDSMDKQLLQKIADGKRCNEPDAPPLTTRVYFKVLDAVVNEVSMVLSRWEGERLAKQRLEEKASAKKTKVKK